MEVTSASHATKTSDGHLASASVCTHTTVMVIVLARHWPISVVGGSALQHSKHKQGCTARDGVEQPLLWLQGLLAGRTGLGDTLSADASVLRMEEWMDESLEPCFIDRESLLPDEGLACCLLLSIGSLMLRGLKQMHCRQVLSLC